MGLGAAEVRRHMACENSWSSCDETRTYIEQKSAVILHHLYLQDKFEPINSISMQGASPVCWERLQPSIGCVSEIRSDY